MTFRLHWNNHYFQSRLLRYFPNIRNRFHSYLFPFGLGAYLFYVEVLLFTKTPSTHITHPVLL